jgi:hypothetical protein
MFRILSGFYKTEIIMNGGMGSRVFAMKCRFAQPNRENRAEYWRRKQKTPPGSPGGVWYYLSFTAYYLA